MTVRDAFSVIGLPPARYTAEELHAAYRRKAAEVHPDREGGSREAWDELEAAYALLVTHGQDYAAPPSGSTDMLGSQTWWRWRTSGRLVRVPVVILIGGLVWLLLLWPQFREASERGISWQFPAVFSGYVTSWWLWWLWREGRRRAAKPITWFAMVIPRDAEGLRQFNAWLKAKADAEGYSEERPYK